MGIDHEQIRRDLRAAYLTIEGMPTEWQQVWAFENRPFKPTGEFWGKETMHVISQRRTANGVVTFRGMLRLDLFAPEGSGTEIVGTRVNAITEAFSPFRNVAGYINVHRAEPTSGTVMDGWFTVGANLYFRVEGIYQE